MKKIGASELIINDDGTVFHLHLSPEEIADRIILVGDPDRVNAVAARFDSIEHKAENREFRCITGHLKGKRISVLSTGIGTDNIDIVMNELDALANVDFATREVKKEKKNLYLLRLGTCGAIQPDIELGTNIISSISVGMDGLLNFYEGVETVSDSEIENVLNEHIKWNGRWARPYVIHSDKFLIGLMKNFTVEGVTISAPGFYAPQGRVIRMPLQKSDFMEKIESFSHNGLRLTNFEMESSAIAGLAALMGHQATTICTVIAQRAVKESKPDYKKFVDNLIDNSLERFVSF